MRHDFKNPPRMFGVGDVQIADHGKVHLNPWDMVSIVREGGHECDVTATDWGLYLAPSLNHRLRDNGYRVALVRNPQGRLFLNAVLEHRMDAFLDYLEAQESVVVTWFDESGDICMPEKSAEKLRGSATPAEPVAQDTDAGRPERD